MLAHDIVKYEASEPSAYMVFLHGILGTRANWRSIARQFVKARPEWGAVLVDLREHGDSLDMPPPHTIEAAAEDVIALERDLALPIGAALGHSFGGKVALEWLRLRGGDAEVWLIDSSPGAKPLERGASITAEVIAILEGLQPTWPSRDAFISSVVAAGQPKPIAQWLAMNLHQNDDGTRSFGPDLVAIRAMIESYARADLWPIVESPPASSVIHAVIGGASPMFSAEDRGRIEEIAAKDSNVSVDVFENAQHWVHIDAPDALLALLTSAAGEQP